MTNEELKTDCGKFIDYLQDNGVEVKGHLLQFNEQTIYGYPAVMVSTLLYMVADSRGYKVVKK